MFFYEWCPFFNLCSAEGLLSVLIESAFWRDGIISNICLRRIAPITDNKSRPITWDGEGFNNMQGITGFIGIFSVSKFIKDQSKISIPISEFLSLYFSV